MIKLFYSYSHKDESFRDDMEKHLATLQQGGFIEEWHDRRIEPGQEIQGEIDRHLHESDVILLLLSPDFLASSECIKEIKRSLDLHGRGQARVVPIIVRPCPWKSSYDLSKLLALPKDGKPISEWKNRDRAFLDIYNGIKKILEVVPFSLRKEVKDDITEIEFISHSDDNARLDDFFVFPNLVRQKDRMDAAQGRDYRKSQIGDFTDIWRESKRIVVVGDDKSGKTVICRKLFLHQVAAGVPVVLLRGEDIRSPVHHENLIINSFRKQFRGGYDFWKRQEGKTLVIDEFTSNSRLQFIDFAKENFSSIFVAMSEDEYFSYFKDEVKFADFEFLRIQPLSHVKQEQLIRKWKALGAPAGKRAPITDGVVDQIEDRLNSIILHNRVVPRYPFYVLSVLQTYEAFMPRSLQITAYGHCYQSLITANLVKSGMQGDDIDSAFNFLGYLAFAMHENSGEFSRKNLEEFLKVYRKKYVIRSSVVNRCTEVAKPVVRFLSGQYVFRYPFVYYFFLGYYLARHYEECKEQVNGIAQESYRRENAFILIFMIHHTQNEELVNMLLSRAMVVLDDVEPATLSAESTRLLEEALEEVPDQVASERSVESAREIQRKHRDRIESDLSADDDPNEDEEAVGGINDIYRSLKNMEVLGQILKNKYGSLPKSRLEEIVKAISNAGLRLVSIFTDQEGIRGLEKYLTKRAGDQDVADDDRQRAEFLRKYLRPMVFVLTYGMLRKIGVSIRKPELLAVIRDTYGKGQVPAYDLLRLFFVFDTAVELQESDVDYMEELCDGFRKEHNVVAERLLSLAVQTYASTHYVPYKLRQRMYKKLDIRYKANLPNFKK